MSIVISLIANNNYLCIASDLRAIRNGEIYDNFQKIYSLRKNVFFAMTGIAEEGLDVLFQLQTMQDQTPLAFIARANELVTPSKEKLAIMLAGKDLSGNFFIWQKNQLGEIRNANITNGKNEPVKSFV